MDESQLKNIIASAEEKNLSELSLGHKGIKSLPKEIGRLHNLKVLYLRNNPITSLPPEIGKLKSLHTLYLQYTQLSALPAEIGLLQNLEYLEAYGTGITALPDEIGNMKRLRSLNPTQTKLIFIPKSISALHSLDTLILRASRLRALPEELGALANLTYLDISHNEVEHLPSSIGKLTKLQRLEMSHNRLTRIPSEIGQLKKLMTLNMAHNSLTVLPAELGRLNGLDSNRFYMDIEENPLLSPPPAITTQGTAAIASYLRGQLENSKKQWISKLLLVGEGGVGKTSLLRALLKEPFNLNESTTHGIAIRSITCAHPFEDGVRMQLNAWDFGGQEIYHATHQFFLTNRSIFMLVWNARLGFEQGKLYYWLDTIQALAPESPVLIVATHIDERDAALPLAELKTKYPMIAGHWVVSNRTNRGIEELTSAIAQAAASLPLMGETWPGKWLRAAEIIRELTANSIDPSEMHALMSSCGLDPLEQRVLATWMHELGDILYFQEDDELRDMVILKPEWVTGLISKVLESEKVINDLGIFTRDDMDDVWSEIRLPFEAALFALDGKI